MRSVRDILFGAVLVCLLINGVILFVYADSDALLPFIMCAVATVLNIFETK